jgi:siderophore synthetase component
VPDVAAQPRALPGARTAVLARLWGGLVREPIPGLGPRERSGDQVAVKLPDGSTLRGEHRAAEPFARVGPDFALHLDDVAVTDPAALARTLGLERLAVELADSVANLALARSAQPPPDGGPPLLTRAAAAPDPLVHLEQSIVDGHPLHPCCRTRLGLSADEVTAYAPEHRPTIELAGYDVPADRWLGVNAPARLWVHPWQRDHVVDRYPWLRDSGERHPARPLMSLRTVALVADPSRHVKTAVDVQMTSAVRTVSPAALHNGPLLSALVERLGVAGLTLLPEVAGGAVLVDGEPSRSLAMLHRRRPALAAGELAFPLAALAAPSPVDGRPLLVECVGPSDPLAYLDRLANVLLPPLLTLLGYGVALEAHGQNLLLVVQSGQPMRLLYRDFGGVRVSPARLRRHGIDPPALRGDLITDDPDELRTKLAAAAVSTVVAEVVALLEHEYGIPAAESWARVAAVLRSAELPPAAAADRSALLHEALPLKATTAMRVAADPLADQWIRLPNPMEAA